MARWVINIGSFISKQPNGKYCRFSTIVDCPTHINMTFNDYVRVIMERGYQEEKAKAEAQDIINNYLYHFEEVIDRFIPNNMSKKEFERCLKKMNKKDAKYETP